MIPTEACVRPPPCTSRTLLLELEHHRQAPTDLVQHGVNAWMVDVEDVEALAGSVMHAADASPDELARMREAGRVTADENSYPALRPRWLALLDGFVAMGDEE